MPTEYFWGRRLEQVPSGETVLVGTVWTPENDDLERLEDFLSRNGYVEQLELMGRDFDYTPLQAIIGELGRYGLLTVKLERRDADRRAYGFVGPGHVADTLRRDLAECAPSIEFGFYVPLGKNWLPHIEAPRTRHGAD